MKYCNSKVLLLISSISKVQVIYATRVKTLGKEKAGHMF